MSAHTPPSQAELAFEDYLDRMLDGETVDVALFLREQPAGVRPDLQRMIDDWHVMRLRFGGEEAPLPGTSSGGYEIGEPLGQGTLLPGHFADLDEGFRVGFVDLKRWSEIDVSRRNYGEPVLGAGLVAVLGVLIWPLAAWRGR